jgi:hypothetical protein
MYEWVRKWPISVHLLWCQVAKFLLPHYLRQIILTEI